MASVTAHYGIVGPVPFIDVDADADNPLFVDPCAVRFSDGPLPFAREAVLCLDSFLDSLTSAVATGDVRDHIRALDQLQSFNEPWETRMGMSAEGFLGHGGASVVGSRIWTALSTDLRALVEVGVLRRLEHLPMFVEGVDRDITSDITTRIIFGPLSRFTNAMLAEHPELSSGPVAEVERQVWDPSRATWKEERMELPVISGKPLLLVPLGWARPHLLMSSRRYFETSLLSYVQGEQSAILPSGKVLAPPKWALKKQKSLGRGRATNAAVTLRACHEGDDLIRLFEAFVASRHGVDEVDAA